MPENSPNLVAQVLEEVGAIYHGHCVYESEEHGARYFSIADLTPEVDQLMRIARHMVPHYVVAELRPDIFIGPAEGAIVPAAFVTWAYNQLLPLQGISWSHITPAQFLYASKTGGEDKGFTFRRRQGERVGGKRVVVLDDAGTTGESVGRVVELVRSLGGIVIEVGYIVQRTAVSPTKVGGVPVWSPLTLNWESWPAPCPLCLAGDEIRTDLGHGAAYVAAHGQPGKP